MQEEQKNYKEKDKRQEDVPEKDADLDEANSNETEQDVKVEDASLESLSLRQRMRALPPHHLPLKERMRDKTISYRNLLQSSPLPRNHPRSMQYGNIVDRHRKHCNTKF